MENESILTLFTNKFKKFKYCKIANADTIWRFTTDQNNLNK